MGWLVTDDPDAFVARAGALLRSDPVRHTMPLSQLARLQAAGPPDPDRAPELCSWHPGGLDGPATGVAVHMPPLPTALATMPLEAASALASVLTPPAVEVAGDPPLVEAFVAAWTARTGVRGVPDRLDALMVLGELEEPIPPAGRAMVASYAERRVAVELVAGFWVAVGDEASAGDAAPLVDDRMSHGGVTLWYDEHGEAVAVACLNRLTAGTCRIGPVFTRPEHRGRGYAGALTASLARQALAAGAEHVVLFADVANRTSTGLYERLGFRARHRQLVMQLRTSG